MSAAHTAGPWKWVSYGDYSNLEGPSGALICDDGSAAGEYGPQINVDGPDARVIAAAPDLLAALKGVVAVADRKTDEFDDARAAIAKAEGKAP